MIESQTMLLHERHAPVDILLLLFDDALQDDACLLLLLDEARNLQPLPLAKLAASTTSQPLFISQMMVSACATVGVEGKAGWLVGVSTDSHFIMQLDTQEADAGAAVQLISFLEDRVVFACGSWLGTVSRLDTEQPLSSLESQPHHDSAITHLLTGIT
jgi:hypothetical protein